MEGSEPLTLPNLSDELLNGSSYYRFENERILFVNVERDYNRIAPILEPAFIYASSNEVYFFDLARPRRNWREKTIHSFKSLFRGKWIPDLLSKYISEFGIEVIDWKIVETLAIKIDFQLSDEDIRLIKLAKRNEDVSFSMSALEIDDWFEREKTRLNYTYILLVQIMKLFKFDRVFCWNGRFVLSTLVHIACNHSNIANSVIEMGSSQDSAGSFEIFRTNPWDFEDTYNRMNYLRERQEKGLLKSYDSDEIRLHFRNYSEKRFVSNFDDSSEVKTFDVMYFTSSLYELGTRSGWMYQPDVQFRIVSEIDSFCAKHGLSFGVRVHPNPTIEKYERWEKDLWINKFGRSLSTFTQIIPPDSRQSSYILASKAKFNICMYSSMGFELDAMKLPVLVLNPEFGYGKTQDMFFSWVRCRLHRFILVGELPGMSEEELMLWGNYMFFRGFSFERFHKLGESIYFDGLLIGKERLADSLFLNFFYSLYRNLRINVMLGERLK